VTDSGCDVSKEYINGENCMISHVPITLQLGETVFSDDENLDLNEYLQTMENHDLAVKTAAPSPNLFFEKFKEGENVFCLTISSKLSATYQSAMSAKDMYIEEFGNKFIHIFDSLTAAMGQGVIAMKIAELCKSGTAATEIVDQVNDFIKSVNTYFIIDKFDNLVKTGRMKPYVAKIASFLNVKPICGDENGEIKLLDKARGYTKAVAKMIKLMRENTPDMSDRIIGITHVQAPEKALSLKEEFITHLKPKDVVIQECRGVTTTFGYRGGVVVAV
jgi:DegV family protein with EDD domain